MDYIEVLARTIADAVAKGTEQLKADGKVVTDKKVLEQPSSGFLGIGRRDALVRLYFEEAPLTEKVAFAAEKAAADVQEAAQNKVAEAKMAVAEASEFVQEKVADAKSTAMEAAEIAQQKFGEVKDKADEMAEAAKDKFAKVKEQAQDVADDVKENVADTAADAKETVKDVVATAAAAVKPQREPVSKEEQIEIADKGKQFLQDMFSKMGLAVQIEKMMTAEKSHSRFMVKS